jgi:hypothetical protein
MRPNGAAKPVLQTNAAVVAACLIVQHVTAWLMGVSTGVDGAALLILMAAIVAALLLLKVGKPALGMHLYAIAGMATVGAMTAAYLADGGDNMPPVLLMVHAGLVCISLTLGWRVGRYYAVAATALLAAIGIAYGQPDDAVVSLALLSIFTVLARLVGKLALKVQDLEEAVGILKKAVRAATNGKADERATAGPRPNRRAGKGA